jgi:hypothetical protein
MNNAEDLAPNIGEPPAVPAAFDGRRYPRYSFRGRARAIVFEAQKDGEPVDCEVMTTDISREGLSLLHRKQLSPGQQILLVLNDTTRLVEVRWCCRAWAGLYAAGCVFIGLPADGPIVAAADDLRSRGQKRTP